ncbi:hypothetical protein QR680_011862 [Steinernema hermaphroditum]|nr:hypothetical protein QR680_011862 [Steinernema hermaphroditum]
MSFMRAATLCRSTGLLPNAVRLHTSALTRADAKTPIQKLGWEYLMRQKALNRPISPHLQIYQPQLTWYLSGLHRISGCVMAGTLLIGGLGFAALPVDFTTFIEYIRSWNIPSVITGAFQFIVAFPIVFHTLNGVRFLGFDLAMGTDIVSVYRSGWFVFGISIAIALAVVIAAKKEQKKLKKL